MTNVLNWLERFPGAAVCRTWPWLVVASAVVVVAVLLGAIVVRCLLVPALMGKINWYTTGWLGRIVPHVIIEGAEFFRERDRIAASEREPQPVA
jgi:uncharacterized membrane protein YdfJ with MMPL/SSD domain